MNAAEGLAREIRRVTELRCQYEEIGRMPNVMVEPALTLMNIAASAMYFTQPGGIPRSVTAPPMAASARMNATKKQITASQSQKAVMPAGYAQRGTRRGWRG